MDEALNKFKVMDLADNILVDTVHLEGFFEFYTKRKINKNVSDEIIVGVSWYAILLLKDEEQKKK
jgi:hypothetical protein